MLHCLDSSLLWHLHAKSGTASNHVWIRLDDHVISLDLDRLCNLHAPSGMAFQIR